MGKLPQPPLRDEDFEAPTLKRAVPAELRDADEGGVHTTAYVTTKLRKAEIEALLSKERQGHQGSGMRRAVSDEEIERFERREARTLPAPPDASAEEEKEAQPLAIVAAKPPPLPPEILEEVADLDADDER